MIDRQGNGYVFECDGCADVITCSNMTFEEALEKIKEEGWKPVRREQKDIWEHYCEDCKD